MGPNFFQNLGYWVRKLAQQVKELVTKPDYLSSIPEIHMGEGESRLPGIVI